MEWDRATKDSIGKTVVALEVANDILILSFADGKQLRLWDNGQSCCESRYMHTDDDLAYHCGAQLRGVELRDAPEEEYGDGAHEVQFLAIKTSRGEFVVSNHNVHNGYYSGFGIVAEVVR